MFKTFKKSLALASLSVCAAFSAFAQTHGNYAPYSIYGLGDIATPGTAYNKTMAGVGIASRNTKYINILNPAAVTARDTLTFMADFSLYGDNKIFKENNLRSANNTYNIGGLVMSFPIWKSSAFMVGLTPYSGTGYGYKYSYTDPSVIGKTGNITYAAEGIGAVYQAFLGAGVTFFKRLSLGAQANYYFGETDKIYTGSFSDETYSGITSGYQINISAFSGKFGIQYEQPIGKRSKIGIGATYSMDSNVGGYLTDYSISSSSVSQDTLSYHIDTLHLSRKIKLAGELGLGITFNCGDNWMVEFDYTRSDWRGSGFSSVPGFQVVTGDAGKGFTSSLSQSFRLGFEFIPNKNDIRYYFNKVSYRGGVYYKTESFKVDGYDIHSMGITLGATFPVFRLSNGITFGLELGQRGGTSKSLIKENYLNFSLGFNLYDIWFRKAVYE